MSWFWIVGIIVNVALTVAAIVWVLRQGRPRSSDTKDTKDRSAAP